MSWAAHNPEKYDELCVDGVTSKLVKEIKAEGFDDVDYDTVRIAVEVLQRTASGPTVNNAWSHLMSWAADDISGAEGSYFSGFYQSS